MNGPLARFVARTCLENAFEESSRDACGSESERMVRTSEDGTSYRRSSYLHPSEQTRDFRSHVVGIRWRRRDLGNGSPPTTRQVRRLAVPMGCLESKRSEAPG